jgi:hypothetical protein
VPPLQPAAGVVERGQPPEKIMRAIPWPQPGATRYVAMGNDAYSETVVRQVAQLPSSMAAYQDPGVVYTSRGRHWLEIILARIPK